jgi:ATP-dependent Clp protease ATP-binding subunit ClpA
MVKRLESDARWAVLTTSKEEAQRRGDRRVGTDHLLLGLLRDRGSVAAEVLGVDLAAARAAADELDRSALTAIGISPGEQRLPAPTAEMRRVPLTSGARTALKLGIEQAREHKARTVQSRHLLAALLGLRHPDPAAQLLVALGVDPDAALARLEAAA